jgi:phosphoribosylaminoimidazolecarboxamide formyltransferase/IMP cyclohydrolase
VAANLAKAYDGAFTTDPVSAFGGIIAFNREVDAALAQSIIDRQFVEVLIAPAFEAAALEALSAKTNVRVMSCHMGPPPIHNDARRIASGLLIQTPDDAAVGREDCRVVTDLEPDDSQWQDLLFAWRTARMVKSNAIVYAAGGRTLGVGAGQMSRVDSARIARWKAADAGLDLQGSAMASDAFFPFRDGIDTAAEAGVRAVIQPGGSMRDDEVIAAANEHGMTMVFTGIRHFRH